MTNANETPKTCENGRHTWTRTGSCRCGELTRCCVSFTNGKQCRGRQVDGSGWCAKHAPIFDEVAKMNSAAIKAAADHKDATED